MSLGRSGLGALSRPERTVTISRCVSSPNRRSWPSGAGRSQPLRWGRALAATYPAVTARPRPVARLTVARTVRTRLIAVPARLVNRSGALTLRGPANWPWAQLFTNRLAGLRALQPDTG